MWGAGSSRIFFFGAVAALLLAFQNGLKPHTTLVKLRTWIAPASSRAGTQADKFRRPEFTACMVFLTIGANHSKLELVESMLAQFNEKISTPLKHRYPAIVLHDGWITGKIVETLSRAAGDSKVMFEFVNISDTPAMKASPHRFRIRDCLQHSRAYRDMNRVFIRLLFELQALRKFDYWMRIDMDIRIDETLRLDPFAIMDSGGYDFGYMQCRNDWGCNAGLLEFFMGYAGSVNISDPVFFDDVLARGLYFYGNIGVGRVSLFTSPQYTQFAQEIDDDGGIMRHRWDDQHVYAVAIALFSNFNRTIGFTFDMLPFYHRGEPLEHRPCHKNQRSLGGSRGVIFSS
jgi:hypothetical protein